MVIHGNAKKPSPAISILLLANAIVFSILMFRTGNLLYLMFWIINVGGFSLCYSKYKCDVDVYRIGQRLLEDLEKLELENEMEEES